MKNIQNQIFFITILFFALGFIHISLSLLGLVCFILPFVQYLRHKDKIWCKYYCPRAGFFTRIISKVSLGKKVPSKLIGPKMKRGVVIYFTVNLFFVLMSTIMVTIGRIDPIEQIRFLILFGMPFKMPQLITLDIVPNLLHLSYRVYSMMFTSVIVGTGLGILYKPRTWCAVCPINTLTS